MNYLQPATSTLFMSPHSNKNIFYFPSHDSVPDQSPHIPKIPLLSRCPSLSLLSECCAGVDEISIPLRSAFTLFQEKCPPSQTRVHPHLKELISIFSVSSFFPPVLLKHKMANFLEGKRGSADRIFHVMKLFIEKGTLTPICTLHNAIL